MGYSKERGDTLTVKNAPFDGVDKPVPPPEVIAWWRDPELIAWLKEIGKGVFVVLLFLFLFLRFLRPLMRPVMRKLDEISDVPPLPKPAPPLTEEQAQEAGARSQLEELESSQNKGYRENLAMAKALAKEDPRVVANVVKAWVGANE
jgi:flagellar M-ring protein FliF